MGLPRFLGEYEEAAPHDGGEINSEFNDFLEGIDKLIGPEQPDDHFDDRDISVWDRQTSPMVSAIVEPEEVRQGMARPRAPSSPLPPIPPSPPPRDFPRPKKKSIVGKAWKKFKLSFMRRFLGGDQPVPKLSDKLALERDDGVWYDVLFSKPTRTRE